MGNSLAGRLVGFIIMTFVVAMIYGFFCTTRDFMNPHFDPVATGHQAAENVYGLFGTVSGEIQRDDGHASEHVTTVAHKIAMPYAVTADLTALFGGKMEAGIWNLFHTVETHVDVRGHEARG